MTEPRYFRVINIMLLVECLFLCSCRQESVEKVTRDKREHPFLFADSKTIDRAKSRAKKYPWAADQLNKIINEADEILKKDVSAPDEGAQWPGHYVCKKCNVRLKYTDGKHVCPECGTVYTGWPYDQVIYYYRNNNNFRQIRVLGMAYAFTNRETYAEKAREILLDYARKYPAYKLHDIDGKTHLRGARLYAQTLDEAAQIIPAVWGYDLIYNSPSLSAGDRETIESQLFRQVARTVRGNNEILGNWQSWHNAALAAIGFCLQDEELSDYAMSGLRFQLEKSVAEDGFWHEGTPAYHYYALGAIQTAAEIAHYAGIDIYKTQPSLKAMYEAPLLYAFGDMTFPAVGDSDISYSITRYSGWYELAYARFGDPRFLPLARCGDRQSFFALLWGVEELPPAPPIQQIASESRNFSGLGAAILRQGGADQLHVHLDYNTPDRGHGHPDKLAIIVFGLGRLLGPDPGRGHYRTPLHYSWYGQTFAHNTVCVDQQSHRPATGNLTMFQSQGGFVVAQAECDSAYPGVKMKRTVAINKRYLIDIFSVTSDAEHTYDWVYHNFGQIVPALPVAPREEKLGEKAGYQHMKDIAQAKTAGTWSADFKQDGANVRLTMLAAAGTELYFGMGLADNPPRSCPMVVVRRKGKTARFISIIEPYKEAPAVTGVKMIPVSGGGGAITLEITCGGQRDLFILAGRATERIN